jgi:hypothetical protein
MKGGTVGEAETFILDHTTDATEPLDWKPVGLTFDDWAKQAGGYVSHQGMFFRNDQGVWMAGMIGCMYLGAKTSDGRVLRRPRFDGSFDSSLPILDYVDRELGDCYRLPSGRLVCTCGDDL